MSHFVPQRAIPSALLAVVCAGLCLAWLIEPAFAPTSLGTRLGLLAACSTLILLAFQVLSQRQSAALRAARRQVELLCQFDWHKLGEDGAPVPDLPEHNPWRDVLRRVREVLETAHRQLHEVEHARAGADVRAHRIVAERDQLRELVEGLPEPLLVVNRFDEILLTNQAADRLLQGLLPASEKPTLACLESCRELIALLNETRRRKTPSQRHAEVTLVDGAGRAHAFRITCRSLASEGETPAGDRAAAHGAVAMFTDISLLKTMQKRNAEFVSAVSHEMKTPLAGIKAYVELLADGDAQDEQTREEFLQVINSQADRLQRLIDNLLNLARIEAGVVAVHKEPRSLNELLAEAVDVLRPAAEQKDIVLAAELSPLYLGVHADRDTLLQAAINLASNAVKYTPRGGKVTLRSRLDGDQVVFEVQDTGVGLSSEDCQKVFEKFYRVKKDREMAPGTGLGLPLVKHIVEDIHGGRVEVDSQLGQGSTFRVVLPGLVQLSA